MKGLQLQSFLWGYSKRYSTIIKEIGSVEAYGRDKFLGGERKALENFQKKRGGERRRTPASTTAQAAAAPAAAAQDSNDDAQARQEIAARLREADRMYLMNKNDMERIHAEMDAEKRAERNTGHGEQAQGKPTTVQAASATVRRGEGIPDRRTPHADSDTAGRARTPQAGNPTNTEPQRRADSVDDAAESLKSLKMDADDQQDPHRPVKALGDIEAMEVDEPVPQHNPVLPDITVMAQGREMPHREAKDRAPDSYEDYVPADDGKLKRKRADAVEEGSDEERKPGAAALPRAPAWQVNEIPCIRCTEKKRECHNQRHDPSVPTRKRTKRATACYECASKKQGCTWPPLRGAGRGKDDDDDDDEEQDELENPTSKAAPRKKVKAEPQADKVPPKPRAKKSKTPKSAAVIDDSDGEDGGVAAAERALAAARRRVAEKKRAKAREEAELEEQARTDAAHRAQAERLGEDRMTFHRPEVNPDGKRSVIIPHAVT